MNLTETAIRRPVTTLMVFISMVVVGLISTKLIPLEFFPEVEVPFISVSLPYPGASPQEVEEQITRPIEEVLATLSNMKSMRSWSNEDGAQIWLEFEWGEDTEMQALKVREKIDGIRPQLPADMERYFVRQESSSDWSILELRISSKRDLSGSYELLDRKLKRAIERIDGVSSASLHGVEPKEIRIELLADRIAAYRVDLVGLTRQLRRANFSVSAGKITDGNRRYTIRPTGALKSPGAVGRLVLNRNGLRLDDIARVTYDDPELQYGRHLDRSFAVALEVKKESGANTVAVVDRVLNEIEGLHDDPEMHGIEVYEMDNMADGIVSSLNELFSAGMLGGLFAVIILFFFLRHLTTTLIVALAVPLSLLVTIGVMYFLGFTLNILSMMGLMLAIGMLVDNAVVVTESIHRHHRLLPDAPVRATMNGVKEVALAVTAGTFTTAIVFLPMIVSQADEVTLYLRHVSVAICVALVASLFISLTAVPLLTARLHLKAAASSEGTLVARTIRGYTRVLGWLLRHPVTSWGLAVLILASVAIPANFVKQDFFHDEDGSGQIRLFYHINGTYKLERVEAAVDKAEDYLYAHQDAFGFESVYSWYETGFAMSTIIMDPERIDDIDVEALKKTISAGLPKLTIGVPNFTRESPEGRDKNIRVTVRGESSERLSEIADNLAMVLSHVDGLKDVQSEAARGNEEIRVVVDRDRARRFGLTTDQVARTVEAGMRGIELRRLHLGDDEVRMRLAFQGTDRRTMDNLRNLMLQRQDGPAIKLASVADLVSSGSPRGIFRENRTTMIGVRMQPDGITKDEARERMERVLARYDLPPGYSWGFGQQFFDEAESQNIMMMNLLLALALIYLVMAALFESLAFPAAIWSSIVFAIVGVFWFFLFTNTTMTVMAWIGILVLVGVVVNNGIVLIDHINTLRGRGMARNDAILRAGAERFRPIVMTAATTILGLIPLCVSHTLIGGNGPPYYPMARAIVGGLAFSTVVTLIILPSIYVAIDGAREWAGRLAREARRIS